LENKEIAGKYPALLKIANVDLSYRCFKNFTMHLSFVFSGWYYPSLFFLRRTLVRPYKKFRRLINP
jgi:hypothetical protein